MKQNFKRKLMAGLLSACMIFQTAGMVPVYAVENVTDSGLPIGTSAVCENHTEHTAECGYVEAVEGSKCTHEHTEDCYTEVEECLHKHTAECYPEADDEDATKSDAAEPTECTHICNEENGCITKKLDCQHEHDEECGYVEAVKGSPCTHSCELCEDSEKDTEEAIEDELAGDSIAQKEICLCDPVVSSEGVHTNEECPFYVQADSEQMTVEQLLILIDALPSADEITDENRDTATADFEAVWTAYEELSEDETITDLDGQLGAERMAKLIALREVLLDMVTLEEGEVYAVYGGNGMFYLATADDPYTKLGVTYAPKTINHLYIDAEVFDTDMMSSTNLKTVTCADTVTTIGQIAFDGCTNLISVTMPNVTTIEQQAFRKCGFTNIDLSKVTTIGVKAFIGCTNLTSIDTLAATEISNSAFENCTGLTSVKLSNAETIGAKAFSGCTNLASVELPKATEIVAQAFYGGGNTAYDLTKLTSVKIPNVTTIGGYAFKGCTSLATIELPKTTTVGDNAFEGCTSLATIELPKTTTVRKQAFYDCTGLTSVALPKAETIGEGAFKGCTSLTSLTLGATPPAVDSMAFFVDGGVTSTRTLTIQGNPDYQEAATLIAAYKAVEDGATDDLWYGWTLSSEIVAAATTGTLEVTTGNAAPTYGTNNTITLTATFDIATNVSKLRTLTTNQVEFKEGSTSLGTVTAEKNTDGKWVATLDVNTKDWAVGEHNLTAEYAGNTQLSSATANVTVTVSKATMTGEVTITGTAAYGATLTADTSALKDSSGAALSGFTYQWKNAGSDIASATGSTYTVAVEDLGKAITVEVTPSNTNYSAKTSAAVIPAKAASGITFTSTSLDKTYDGSAVSAPVKTTNYTTTGSTGAVTFEWYQGTTKLTSAPTNAGSYTVKALLAEDATHEAASDTKSFTITAKAITPTIEAISNQTYTGSALEPALTVKDGDKTLTLNTDYTAIYSDNINAGTGTGKAAVTLKGNYSGSANATFTIDKAAGATISSVSGSYTGDGTNFTYTIAPISGAEYSKDNSAWQDSNVFTGFAVSNTITFYARMKADNNHLAGAAKSTDAVTFAKLNQTAPTLNYTVTGATGSKKITITKVEGAEYSFDGTTFGAINEKTFSTDSTETIAIRMKETATHLASSAATASVNLANKEQAAPAAFTLGFTINKNQQTFTATIPTVNDGEYSFDGVTYGDSNTKTDCQSGSDYTGYVRIKAKAGYNASPATSDTRKAPKVLSGIAITTPPVKISYTEGDSFDQTGMKVTATYADSSTTEVSGYTVSPSGNLAAGTTQVTVTFTEGGITKTATQTITVASKPSDGANNSGGNGGSSGGGSSSGGSSGGSTGGSNAATDTKTDTSTIGKTEVKVYVDKNGNAMVSVTDKAVADAIKQAQDAAKKNGTEKNGISVEIKADTGSATNLTANLPKTTVDALVTADVKETRITSGVATIALNLDTLKEVQKQVGADVTVTATKVDNTTLSAEAKAVVGSRPVYDLSITGKNGAKVTSFGGGKVSVSIPYTLGANEKAGNVVAYYIDSNGKVQEMPNSSYDFATKTLSFVTDHFSKYAVGYKANTTTTFTDIANHWAKADIEFTAARGLLSGTGNNQFSPDTGMTRGMFVTALGRLAGIDKASYTATPFTDVNATAYYAPYVAWAAEKGIVKGTTATTFAPDTNITRAQMAVIMTNYAAAMGYEVPKTHAEITFSDQSAMEDWAKASVKSMQMAGVINGKDGNRFDPNGTATRAEVSAVLHRYVELVIDPATAQGWTQNADGHWLYYKDGKTLTGWQTVDGLRYYFNSDGVMHEGWKQSTDGKWYYWNTNGAAIGWAEIDKKWYYFGKDGVMLAGKWIELEGKWYYLKEDGTMAVSTTIDGYEVDDKGVRKTK